MVISISISSEAERNLAAKAAAAGMDVATYAAQTLERIASRPSLDQVLAPIRAEFDASGMTEDELGELLEEAKHEMRGQCRTRRAS